MYIARYVWITKLRGNDLDLQGFKNYINNMLKIQMKAAILTCFEMVNIEHLWS